MGYRIGVDIGGTFTDAIVVSEDSGAAAICKVPTTPADPAVGFINAVKRLLAQENIAPDAITFLVHGTTVATNAIIEGNMARTAFVTTAGFRDMLEIQRQIRPSLYDLQFTKPAPLVPRQHCFEVAERLDATGKVLTPLDRKTVERVAGQIGAAGLEAVAVCLLHAYVNDEHEREAGAILAAALPEVSISLSADIAPEFREYLRASTTVINAGIQPIVASYLSRIETELRQMGLQAELLLMQSSGGVYRFNEARRRPVFMVESGPAAGVIAAAFFAAKLGQSEIISFDMGGTTAKAGLIQAGEPHVSKEYEVGASAQAGTGANRGAGYPLLTPVIDLVEIGAGGGSIAWIDSGGGLRVGPQSAGADPGPACYGLGGTQPTLTDANLILGRLSPSHFLGGEMQLDSGAAHEAIRRNCAEPLGLDVVETALAIVEIANAAMVNALRSITIQRGHDPRDFLLVGFGGAGPVHLNQLAAALGLPQALIPRSPGIASALGLLATDLRHEFNRNMIQPLADLNLPTIEQLFSELTEQGRTALARDGLVNSAMTFERRFDMRYVGQSHELTIPVAARLADDELANLARRFHETHARTYGFSAPAEPIELVNIRLNAIGEIAKPPLALIARDDGADDNEALTQAKAYFSKEDGFVACPIYDRFRLKAGRVLVGPALLVELDSTIVIHPHTAALVDPFGNILLKLGNDGEKNM